MSLGDEHPPHRRIPWLAVALALLAVASLFVGSQNFDQKMEILPAFRVTSSEPVVPSIQPLNASNASYDMALSAAGTAGSRAYYPAPGYNPEIPVTDTREFLKMDYNARLKTRDVQGLVRRAETIVRGKDGRVDQTSSASKYGYVGFVIPAEKFDEFRDEIESLVNARFLEVNITSQNLLPQKLSIEEQQKQYESNLASLQANRKQLIATHNSLIASLQVQIDDNAYELNQLKLQATLEDLSYEARMQNSARQQTLTTQQANLKLRIATENSNYSNQLRSTDQQIEYAQANITSTKKQDQNLLDSVATVRGTIAFNWISVWDIVELYLPGYWIPGILALASLVAYLWHQRRGKALAVRIIN